MPEATPDSPLSEKTKVAIRITSWWHLVVLIVTITWAAAVLKASIDQAIQVASKALEQSTVNDKQLQSIEMDLKVFHQRYEDDMNRYIRDYSDTHRNQQH